MMNDIFDGLFLNEEEQKIYELEKLEKKFIISQEDMLWELDKRRIEALDCAYYYAEIFYNYKRTNKKTRLGL